MTEVLKGIENDPADWIGQYGKVALTGEATQFENYAQPLDRWYRVSAYCPQKGYFVALFEDITQYKKAEASLKESNGKEHFLAELVRNASVAVGVGYPNGRLGMINRAFEKLTGYTEEELHKISWNKVLTPSVYAQFEAEKLAELHRTKTPVRYEKEYVRKDGSKVPVELFVQPFLDDKRNVTHYFSFITDITERRKAEEALEKAKNDWERTFDAVPDFHSDFEYKIQNNSCKQVNGTSTGYDS